MLRQNTISKRQGFTLIELLVVISIIVLASSIIFTAGSGGDGPALSSSLRIVSGIAQGARGQAILKNSETMLIIHNDVDDLDKYRRFIGIVFYQQDDPNTTEDEEGWVAATQGSYLPEGIYFDPELSEDFGSNRSGSNVKAVLDYPRTKPQKSISLSSGTSSTTDSYLFYKFNSNGTSANPNEWLVLRAGNLNADGELDDYDPSGEGAALKAALIFRRAGTTTSVDDPSAIK
ncbi:MAG: type II secretion system protein [Opitutaceae bacterium]